MRKAKAFSISAAFAGLIAILLGLLLRDVGPTATADGPRAAFYAEYRKYAEAPPPDPWDSWGQSDEQLASLSRMARMGPAVLPYLIAQTRRTRDSNLNLPLLVISRVRFLRAGWPGAVTGGSQETTELLLEWWEAGQAGTNEMFRAAYGAGQMERVAALGTAALGLMMEKLAQGDTRMLEAIGEVARGQPDIPEAVAADARTCLTWWEASEEHWLIPFPDQAEAAR